MKKMATIFLGILAGIYSDAYCQTPVFPAGFTSSIIASGWSEPVGATFTTDGQRMFVWEKNGRVYVCNRDGSGNYNKQATPVVNLSEEVGNWRDHGLLGFALDPDYPTNGLIYLLYVVDRHYLLNFGTPSYNPATNQYYSATIGRVTRYQTSMVGGNLVANTGSRTILIGETKSTGMPILHESHGIGALAFTSDGMLLVTCGDGASYNTTDGGNLGETYYVQALADGIIRPEENVGALRSQLLNSHNGKLLRIDPATGNGISSNPFYDPLNPRDPKSRVWAFGFRNPFRIAVKPGSGSTNPSTGDIGEVYVGDVGWNTWEELNIITGPGMNCGWPLYEGHTVLTSYFNLTTQNLDEANPLFGGGCTQQYFMFKNLIKQATADNLKTVYNPCDNVEPIGTGNRYFHRRPALDWQHGQDVARVGIFNGNNAAVATIGTAASGVSGVPFRGNCSVAGTWYNGTSFPFQYRDAFFQADLGGRWLKCIRTDFTDHVTQVIDFGSNFAAIVDIAQNPLDGSLVIVDIGNGSLRRVAYGGNQLPTVKILVDKTYGPSSLSVNFTGDQSFDPDGSISSYSWNFGDGNFSTVANPAHTFSAAAGVPTKFVVQLTVTDNSGGSSVDNIVISVNNTPPQVNITSPVKGSKYMVGPDTIYACTADVTDAEHGPAQLSYAWQTFLRHNNHEHPEAIDPNESTTTRISRIGCNGDSYYWHIELTVTDAAGLATTDSSDIFPDCSLQSPLPVLLSSFSVTQMASTNFVKWVTEQEDNVRHFEVQRGTDGIHFETIYREAATNTTTHTVYDYADNQFMPGNNYYRLMITDLDGGVDYSMVVRTVSALPGGSMLIAPNPVKDMFSLLFDAEKGGPVSILVHDQTGRLVYQRESTVNRGQNILYFSGLSWWGHGIYFITVQQGNQQSHGKLFLDN